MIVEKSNGDRTNLKNELNKIRNYTISKKNFIRRNIKID